MEHIDNQQSMELKPIGFVHNEIHKFTGQNWGEIESEIVVKPELIEALENIDEYSHLIVLFWTKRADTGTIPNKVHPKNNPALPMVGVFATRSPDRPNPVCLAVVELMERCENILIVKGLDAFDETPVIDIKPYLPGNDYVQDAEVPAWVSENQEYR